MHILGKKAMISKYSFYQGNKGENPGTEESDSPPNPLWDLWALSEAIIRICLASLMGESCTSLTRLGAQQDIAIF